MHTGVGGGDQKAQFLAISLWTVPPAMGLIQGRELYAKKEVRGGPPDVVRHTYFLLDEGEAPRP